MLKYTTTDDGTLFEALRPNSEKRVTLVCNGCEKETTTTFANYLRSQKKFKRTGETFCRFCASQTSGAVKRGKPIKKSGPRPNTYGAKHHSWKGGRFIASDGYVQIYVGPRQHKKEHFLVLEKQLGRPLTKVERVHHIDGDKQLNVESNLVLLKDESAHRAAHNSLYRLSCYLIKSGLIVYDRKENSYKAHVKLRELLEQPEEANQQPSLGGNTLEGSTTR